jgi:ERCC4 domain
VKSGAEPILPGVPGAGATFLIARNPDPDSSLPYLLRLPIDGGIELKARAPWPATARVYCHPVEEWPAEAEIVEEVPVRQCARRGRAIDLTLDRARNNRSQFVFTDPHAGRSGGRPMIFWQTARTVRRARPGQRAPTRRAPGPRTLVIDVDSRERYPYRFAGREVECRRSALPCGDYAVRAGDGLLAAVERKTLEDYVKSLVDGSLSFALGELAALPSAMVVVEARYSQLLTRPHVQPGWLAELTARLHVRHPRVPAMFCDSRKLAEDFTHRFLAAAVAEQRDSAVALPGDRSA